MATARYPEAALVTIDINVSGESDSPGLAIEDSDSITFTNLAPFPVSIGFICADGTVFNDISRINANSPQGSSQPPQQGAITVNYWITNLNSKAKNGPYAIQVNQGAANNPAPMLVPISDANPPADEETISVPFSGWLEFDLDAEYTIQWTEGAGVFNTPSTIGPGTAGPYQAQNGNKVQTAVYELTDSIKDETGTGTVKIRS
jgi:hypothetical protein